MGVLNDKQIREELSSEGRDPLETFEQRIASRLIIDPMPDDKQIQACSVDLRLGCTAWLPRVWPFRGMRMQAFSVGDEVVIRPGQFALLTTYEWVQIPEHLMAEMVGKSTIARMGLTVEFAGLVDPGFRGRLTAETVNVSNSPVRLIVGQRFCQLKLSRIEVPGRVYGSDGLGNRYMDQFMATLPRVDMGEIRAEVEGFMGRLGG